MNVYDGNRRKNPKYKKNIKGEKQRKKIPVWWSDKMEADCFPVSENTENKPDLP